eukprot:1242882-Pyramimonas_sp.AAC.2
MTNDERGTAALSGQDEIRILCHSFVIRCGVRERPRLARARLADARRPSEQNDAIPKRSDTNTTLFYRS